MQIQLQCRAARVRRRVGTLGAFTVLSGLVLSPSAWAQDEQIEEIVVVERFVATDGSSALKSNVPLRDVPLTISSYTSAFMSGLETTRIADLYNYMAGVQRAGNTGYDISIRGFSSGGADRNSIQTDGLPGLAVRFGSPPTVGVERIEVVKGPNSVLYGRVQPGGFINIITKKPEATPSHTFRLRADAYNGADASVSDTFGLTASFDSTGALNDSGSVLYRLIAEWEDTKGFRDHGFSESIYIVPSLTWNISDRTDLTLSLEYREEDHALDNFLVVPNRDIDLVADVTTRYQEPDDIQPEEGITFAAYFDHEISDRLHWRTNLRYVDHEDSALGWENLSFRDETTLRRRDRDQFNIREYTFIDTNLAWTPTTGTLEHNILFGVNGGRETSDFERRNFDGGNATLDIDVYNPVYGQGISNPAVPNSHRFTTLDEWGIYLQDQITLNDYWKFVASLRFEDFEATEEDRRGVNPDQTTSDDKTVPMVGLIFQPNDMWSLYASYAESFNPPRPDRRDVNDERNFPPENGEQFEVGAKADLMNGRTTATLSVFSIEKTNVLNSLGGGVWELTGAEESEGFEIEVNAAFTDNWELIFGYANVEATVKESSNPALIGMELRNAPRNTASIWNRVQATERLSFGLGISYVDERWGELPRTGERVLLPSYTIADVVFYYEAPWFDTTLRFGNIFDEEYYESGTNDRRIVPGAPSNIVLSFTKNFAD